MTDTSGTRTIAASCAPWLWHLRSGVVTLDACELGVMHPMDDLWSGQHAPAAAGPDGAIWFVPGGGAREDGRCDGIARYDGTSTARFLPRLCVYDLAFGPGGDAWVLAGEWTGSMWDPVEVGPVEPYVVTSGAVTAAE